MLQWTLEQYSACGLFLWLEVSMFNQFYFSPYMQEFTMAVNVDYTWEKAALESEIKPFRIDCLETLQGKKLIDLSVPHTNPKKELLDGNVHSTSCISYPLIWRLPPGYKGLCDSEQALDFKCACPGGGLSLLVPLSVKVFSNHCLLFFRSGYTMFWQGLLPSGVWN